MYLCLGFLFSFFPIFQGLPFLFVQGLKVFLKTGTAWMKIFEVSQGAIPLFVSNRLKLISIFDVPKSGFHSEIYFDYQSLNFHFLVDSALEVVILSQFHNFSDFS